MNIVFSGPSGAGKGTLTEMFLKDNNFKKFTTCTTRKPREGEKEGFDYYFYDKETFLQKVKAQEMFNVKEYGGNYYGSLEEDMDNIQTMKNVIFQITPDRALKMKERNSNTCMILIIPPTAESLINRRKDRSEERIKNDIQNLQIAKNFDYVIVNENIEQAYKDVKSCIYHFIYGGECEFLVRNNIELIESLISGLNTSIDGKSIEKVFNSAIAQKWDQKAEYVTYYGVKNPITEEVMSSASNGLKIADIGCGTGKILQKLDNKYLDCNLTGLDISSDMISVAQTRTFTGRNNITLVNNDFMEYDFKDYYDIIIFSYVLHHMDNPIEALKKAKNMLTDRGKILFSVPGKAYLSEVFCDDKAIGRFSIEEMDDIVMSAGLYPLKASRNRFMMSFNSYEMFLKYLQSIGTYQKIMGYSNQSWSKEFSDEILRKFDSTAFITGEYLTYNCENLQRKLRRK